LRRRAYQLSGPSLTLAAAEVLDVLLQRRPNFEKCTRVRSQAAIRGDPARVET
jgi:hypothetical protein